MSEDAAVLRFEKTCPACWSWGSLCSPMTATGTRGATAMEQAGESAVHGEDWICPVCGAPFKSQTAYAVHYENNHG